MKNFVRSFIAIVLVISIGITSSIRKSYALATAAAVGSLLISCAQIIKGVSDASQAAEDARNVINHSWIRSYEWSLSTTKWVEVSSDSLNDAVLDLNRGGFPCQVYGTTHNGYQVYVIRALAEPYNVSNGNSILSNSDITGSYLGNKQLSGNAYIYYSLYRSNGSLLNSINNALTSISSNVQTIADRLIWNSNSISYYVSTIDTKVGNIQNYLRKNVDGSNVTITDLVHDLRTDGRLLNTYVDGLESSLTSVDSKITTLNSRLIKTVNGTTYTMSDLGYNAWQKLVDISGYVDQIEGRIIKVTDSGSYTLADLGYNIWQNTSTTNSSLSTMQTTVSNIYTSLQDNSNYPFCVVASSSVDSEGVEWERAYIPYESATDIVAYLNNHYQNRKIKMLNNDYVQSNRFFRRAVLSENGYIRVYCSANQNTHSESQYYLCDLNHNIIVSNSPTYLDKLNSLETAITQVSVDVTNSTTNNSTSFSSIIAPITTLVNASANLELGIDDINLNIGSLIDTIDVGFDDIIGAIGDIPAPAVSRGDLYLSSYTTDATGNAYSVIQSPYQSTTDIIGYINSEMVGMPITLLPRQGVRDETALTRYVDHAYLDSNNFIRVVARNLEGAAFSYFLASPEMAIFQSLTQSDSFTLVQYVDDIESLLRASNEKLDNLKDYTDDLEDISSSILAHLDSSDLVDDQFVSGMVDNWGSHLVYTVLNSNSVLSLFDSAFGDLPSDLDWASARGFFQAFYRGDE